MLRIPAGELVSHLGFKREGEIIFGGKNLYGFISVVLLIFLAVMVVTVGEKWLFFVTEIR